MDKAELHEARTNPEFLNYLEETRVNAIESENIAALYEVLDSMLILDLDEEKINNVYENILKISFDRIEKIVNNNQKLHLEKDEILYVRSFYEHAIEKWSYNDFEGAKEFLFLLCNIVDDEKLVEALKVHFIACAQSIDLDTFYDKSVDPDVMDVVEKYGYFIISFKLNVQSHIAQNEALLNSEFDKLKYLLD